MIILQGVAESRRSAITILVVAAFLFAYGAAHRGSEYDEQYTLFLASGLVRPDFPDQVTTPALLHSHWYNESAVPLTSILARALRDNDVHPPVYFWLVSGWRRLWALTIPGLGRLITRILSSLSAMLGLIGIGYLARACRAPPALAMAIALGCYAFSYTAIIARDFALAETLTIWGSVLALRMNARAHSLRECGSYAVSSGLMLGLACYTNYLAAFIAVPVLLWQMARYPKAGILACVSSASFLPAGIWFFLSQHAARTSQFPPFAIQHAIVLIGRDVTAAIFGGIPRYFSPPLRTTIYGALFVSVTYIFWHLRLGLWKKRNMAELYLLLLGTMTPSFGLIFLGVIFDNTPIEVRYLCFFCPFFSVLIAFAIKHSNYPIIPTGIFLFLQAIGIGGLLIMPQTMQPIGAAVRLAVRLATSHTVVLVPFGNDGVGVAGAFVNSAPPNMKLLVVNSRNSLVQLHAALLGVNDLILVRLATDQQSKIQIEQTEKLLSDLHWKATSSAPLALVFHRQYHSIPECRKLPEAQTQPKPTAGECASS